MASEALCWCASDVRCPHGVSSKISEQWEVMEAAIDEVFCQFDRRSVKRYLKKDADGSAMVVGEDPETSQARSSGGTRNGSRTIARKKVGRLNDTLSHVDPPSASAGSEYLGGSPLLSRSMSSLPRPAKEAQTVLPRIQTVGRPSTSHANLNVHDSNPTNSVDAALDEAYHNTGDDVQGKISISQVPASQMDATINAALMRVVDRMSRAVLPWQALLCPRAIETLLSLRLRMAQNRTQSQVDTALGLIATKVRNFVSNKQSDSQTWLDSAWESWQNGLTNQQNALKAFLETERTRISRLAILENEAREKRARDRASEWDDQERTQVREQLSAFRSVISTAYTPDDGTDGTGGEESRMLNEAIRRVKKLVNAETPQIAREVIRKREDAMDWLASLGENALTAARSEAALQDLYVALDAVQNDGALAQKSLLAAYETQSQTLIHGVETMLAQVSRQVGDNYTRESLLIRGLRQFIVNLLSGDIKAQSGDEKKMRNAWATKNMIGRIYTLIQGLDNQHKADQKSIAKSLRDCKEQLALLTDNIRLQLDGLSRAKEAESRSRKASLHRALAKHVNQVCNERRQRLKESVAHRREEYELESSIILKVDELTFSLRSSLDTAWVREHLRARSRAEGALGRQTRLAQAARLAWHKHSNVTVESEENYEVWVEAYERERDLSVLKDSEIFCQDWRHFQEPWHQKFTAMGNHIAILVSSLSKWASALPPVELVEKRLLHERELGDAQSKGNAFLVAEYEGIMKSESASVFIPQRIPLRNRSRDTLGQETSVECDQLNIPLELPWSLPWQFPFSGDVEQQVMFVGETFHDCQLHLEAACDILASQIDTYYRRQAEKIELASAARQNRLVKAWQHCLDRLDGEVNRRIARLKNMESDLEESIRLCLLQEEVAQQVGEQGSCARLEALWQDWSGKTKNLCFSLACAQQDFDLSRAKDRLASTNTTATISGNDTTRQGISGEGMTIDDILILAKDGGPSHIETSVSATLTGTVNTATANQPPSQAALNNALVDGSTGMASSPLASPGLAVIAADTARIKVLLDSFHPSAYRIFYSQASASLERLRRELGEGRAQYLPLYAIAQCVASAAISFYRAAELGEKCAGRLTCQGVLVYPNGLPPAAEPVFALVTTCAFISSLRSPSVVEEKRESARNMALYATWESHIAGMKEASEWARLMGCAPVDEALALLDSSRLWFFTALLALARPGHDFRRYSSTSEALWTLSVMGITPPKELLDKCDAIGVQESRPVGVSESGIYSDDPQDLLNCLLELPVDVARVDEERALYLRHWQAQQKAKQDNVNHERINAQYLQESFIAEGENVSLVQDSMEEEIPEILDEPSLVQNVSVAQEVSEDEEDPNLIGTAPEPFSLLHSSNPLVTEMDTLRGKVPVSDLRVMAALLGRPDGSFERTTHRVCQMVSIWRRTALALVTLTLAPPSTEFPRIQDILSAHSAIHSAGKRRPTTSEGAMNSGASIQCQSPFEAVDETLDWLTSITHLPISRLQAFVILSHSGSVDPWLEDPRQSLRQDRLIEDVSEFVRLMELRIPKMMNHGEYPLLTFPRDIAKLMSRFDLNLSGRLPLEVLRSFVVAEGNPQLTQRQLSLLFHCLANELDITCEGVFPAVGDKLTPQGPAAELYRPEDVVHPAPRKGLEYELGGEGVSGSLSHDNTGLAGVGGVTAGYRPIVATKFERDPEAYMERFREDVDRYLDSMPTIDTHVLTGTLPTPQTTTAAQQLVMDAVRLDPSARTAMPSSAVVWVGKHNLSLRDALTSLCLSSPMSPRGNWLLHVTPQSVGLQPRHPEAVEVGQSTPEEIAAFVRRLHVFLEVDLIAKYPELSELNASEQFYGPGGSLAPINQMTRTELSQNPTMVSAVNGNDENANDSSHWRELLTRRLHRLERLFQNWREIMLNEWATSLYASRQQRWAQRIEIVQKSVATYHDQYSSMREELLATRQSFIHLYDGLESRLVTITQEAYSGLVYHTSFYERIIRRFQGELERFWEVLRTMFVTFQRHCGLIRKTALERMHRASVRLTESLDESCRGLIVSYTAGHAQTVFAHLMHRGEVWRGRLADIQGRVLVTKEKFLAAKEDADRDLTIQMTDRITLDRTRCQSHLDSLAEDTASMLSVLATVRGEYSALQKDANARLILRIEAVIRECRRLRAAAEASPEVEEAVLSEIDEALRKGKISCEQLLNDIDSTCHDKLNSLQPVRRMHRDRLEEKVSSLRKQWESVEEVLSRWLGEYQKDLNRQLRAMNVSVLESIHEYRDGEERSLSFEHQTQRKLLLETFRKHFREYDLQEGRIFGEFDDEVRETIAEAVELWGPSKPRFIYEALSSLETLLEESLECTARDVREELTSREAQIHLFDSLLPKTGAVSLVGTREQPGQALGLSVVEEKGNSYELSILEANMSAASSNYSATKEDMDHIAGQRMELSDTFSYFLRRSTDAVRHTVPNAFLSAKDSTVAVLEAACMTQSGDMIRPQVAAVLDLLVSAIDMEADLSAGYSNLTLATIKKSNEAIEDWQDFVHKASGETNAIVATSSTSDDTSLVPAIDNAAPHPMSIKSTVLMAQSRVNRRREEVEALVDASAAHLAADHAKLEVLSAAAEKDLSEWANLTRQLIDDAFRTAQETYGAAVHHIPTDRLPSPRLVLSMEGDKAGITEPLEALERIAKLRDMLDRQAEAPVSTSSALVVSVGEGSTPGSLTTLPLSLQNLANYNGEMSTLVEALLAEGETDSMEAASQHARLSQEASIASQETAAREAELAAIEEVKAVAEARRSLPVPEGLEIPNLRTRELQDGWFECLAPEGYVYYHNPGTDESLWDLPMALKVPKVDPSSVEIARTWDEYEQTAISREKAAEETLRLTTQAINNFEEADAQARGDGPTIATPREFLLEAAMLRGPEKAAIRVVNTEFSLATKVDPQVVMAEVSEEAARVADLVIGTALDLSEIVFSRIGREEETIASLLSSRYSADAILGRQLRLRQGEEDQERNREHLQESEDGERKSLLAGHPGGSVLEDRETPKMDDDQLADMLLELSMGDLPADLQLRDVVRPEDRPTSSNVLLEPQDLAHLGIHGEELRNERAYESDEDDEVHPAVHSSAPILPTLERKNSAHLRYCEARERDAMSLEEELSIALENSLENSLCQGLLERLTELKAAGVASPEDRDWLKARVASVKAINVLDIFTELGVSWVVVDDWVEEANRREALRQQQLADLRTSEGQARQARILEHAEDLAELASFFNTQAGLGKAKAKQLATECIVRRIATAKKLAKIVLQRQEWRLSSLPILDADDVVDVEQALNALLNPTTDAGGQSFTSLPLSARLSQQTMGYPQLGGASLDATSSFGRQSLLSLPNLFDTRPSSTGADAVTRAVDNVLGTPHRVSDAEAALETGTSLFTDSLLEPGTFIAVVEESIDEDDVQDEDTNSQPQSARMKRSLSRDSFSTTQKGYYSYGGGWVAGESEAGEAYFYNVFTGESRWDLPEDVSIEDNITDLPPDEIDAALARAQTPLPRDLEMSASLSREAMVDAEANDWLDGNWEDIDPQGTEDFLNNNWTDQPTQPDDKQQYDEQYQEQYDEQYQEQYEEFANNQDELAPYQTDGSWEMSDALGVFHIADFVAPPKPRAIPTYQTLEVSTHASWSGNRRSVVLQQARDFWQVSLTRTQEALTRERQNLHQKRTELYETVSRRVADRLDAFVSSVKVTQRAIKADLGEATATSRDLRRVFVDNSSSSALPGGHSSIWDGEGSLNLGGESAVWGAGPSGGAGELVLAEKLSFILESLERFKVAVAAKYDGAFTQLSRLAADWEVVKYEALQLGDLFEESVTSAREQCRLASEHAVKLFAYDQLAILREISDTELRWLRNDLRKELRQDKEEAVESRCRKRNMQLREWEVREYQRVLLWHETGGQLLPSEMEHALEERGYPAIPPEEDLLTEEELVMSFLLTEVEMEASLSEDYASLIAATHNVAAELESSVAAFHAADEIQTVGSSANAADLPSATSTSSAAVAALVSTEGGVAWFDTHRETLERHEAALHITLNRVRAKAEEGYQRVLSEIDALDFDVETAAENELHASSAYAPNRTNSN